MGGGRLGDARRFDGRVSILACAVSGDPWAGTGTVVVGGGVGGGVGSRAGVGGDFQVVSGCAQVV